MVKSSLCLASETPIAKGDYLPIENYVEPGNIIEFNVELGFLSCEPVYLKPPLDLLTFFCIYELYPFTCIIN